DDSRPVSDAVGALRAREERAGLNGLQAYSAFDEQVKEAKRKLLEFLIAVRRAGKSVAGYGAPGKGNTLLNYCGIRSDFLEYTVDRRPYKQGKLLPAPPLPLRAPDRIREVKPEYVLILTWHFKDEIVEQMAYVREWGGKFVVP